MDPGGAISALITSIIGGYGTTLGPPIRAMLQSSLRGMNLLLVMFIMMMTNPMIIVLKPDGQNQNGSTEFN